MGHRELPAVTLLIYRSLPASVPLPASDERTALAGHRALQTEAAARGELYAVAQLEDKSAARSIRPVGGAHEVTDGPFIETKEWLVGFYLLDCESEAQAIERARMLCPDPSHGVEVRPVTWQWKP
jgi:hypothetical protein